MSLALDLDGLDRLLNDNPIWFDLWVAALLAFLVLSFVVPMATRHLRRSPVEKLIKRRFG